MTPGERTNAAPGGRPSLGIIQSVLGQLTNVYVVAVPLLAVVACIRCRRHGVLLRSGLILAVLGSASWGSVACLQPSMETAVTLFLLGLPLLASGAILLAGGAVRWGLARGTPRPGRRAG